MIPIVKSQEYQKLSLNNTCIALERYFSHIAYKYFDEKKGLVKDAKILDDWCRANKVDRLFSSFKDIVLASYKKLKDIKAYLDSNPRIQLLKEQKEAIKRLYNDRLHRVDYVKSLEITVCPYCNRNYINSTKDRTLCQLDHFFSKVRYPLFYVSFFNLVPVCASCNHIKGAKEFNYSPHDIDYQADELINFSYKLKHADITNPDNIKITLFPQNNIIKNNILNLCIEDIYQIHNGLVSELYKKSQVFNDTFIDMLYDKYKSIFVSKSEIKQFIVGENISKDKYHKQPLSKMLHDISKSFNLL